MTRRVVVDALQVGAQPTGVGRQVQAIGSALAALPREIELELRCTREARPLLAPAFPDRARITTPLARSHPRLRRIVYQQLVEPFLDGADTLLVAPGDQAPLFGRARRLLVVNDVRRLVDDGRPTLDRAWYRLLVPRAARRAHAVATISQFSAREIRRVLGIEARVVSHHPAPRAAAASAPPAGGPAVVVGALRPYKGIDTAVAAVERIPGLRLVAVGPTEGVRVDAAHVDVRGWLSDDDLEQLYRDAAVVVAPSRYEGYGLPVAESIARGKPTVASDIPPHREIGGDAILYFPPGDVEALAERLREALADGRELAERALMRSRALAEHRGSWRELLLDAARADR